MTVRMPHTQTWARSECCTRARCPSATFWAFRTCCPLILTFSLPFPLLSFSLSLPPPLPSPSHGLPAAPQPVCILPTPGHVLPLSPVGRCGRQSNTCFGWSDRLSPLASRIFAPRPRPRPPSPHSPSLLPPVPCVPFSSHPDPASDFCTRILSAATDSPLPDPRSFVREMAACNGSGSAGGGGEGAGDDGGRSLCATPLRRRDPTAATAVPSSALCLLCGEWSGRGAGGGGSIASRL